MKKLNQLLTERNETELTAWIIVLHKSESVINSPLFRTLCVNMVLSPCCSMFTSQFGLCGFTIVALFPQVLFKSRFCSKVKIL